MLESLTPEQEKLADDVAAEYIADLAKPTAPVMPTIKTWLDTVYGFYNSKRPEIRIVQSPQAALKLATELCDGQVQSNTDYCGVGEGGWISFYDYFHRIGVLKDAEAKDLLAMRDFVRCAWDTVLLDECAIVVQRPALLKVDDAGNLHSATGPCVQWSPSPWKAEDGETVSVLDGTGEKDYAWHGTWVPAKIILDPKGYTLAEYQAITNTEVRRALSEAAGWDFIATLLGSKTLNQWTDPKTSLSYELVQCSDTQKLLKKQSPKLKDGSQPFYMEPVNSELVTAQAARKWQAVQTWTPAQCEADPVLEYGVET